MKSLGTKETQGINGDAAALQRRMDSALAAVGAVQTGACAYPRHRGSDWRLAAGGPLVCGVCHPPAPGLDIVNHQEDDRG